MNHQVQTLLAEIKRLSGLLDIEKDELRELQSSCEHHFGMSADTWRRHIEASESESHEARCSKCGIFILLMKNPIVGSKEDADYPYVSTSSSYKLKETQ